MAVKPKAQIIADINSKIISNGNIKAADTNAILKDILDCKELNQQASNLSVFAFTNVSPIIADGGSLNYSLRGIVNAFVNITLKIEILTDVAGSFKFTHDDEKITEALKSIILNPETGSEIDFLVKIKKLRNQASNGGFLIGNLSFMNIDKVFVVRIEHQNIENKLIKGDQIFTSFAIHCPKFNRGS